MSDTRATHPLLRHLGTWRGSSTLQDPTTGKPERSESGAALTTVAGSRFVRIDYTWSYQGTPQDGELLVGYRAKTGEMIAYLVDSWHMAYPAMVLDGQFGGGTTITLRGSYAAPPGPDWGWKIVVDVAATDRLRLEMFNVSPEGEELPAVESEYARMAAR